MKPAEMDYVIHTVFKTNILPVISECNTACVFCSHRQNPEGVEVFRLPRLTLAQFSEIIEFLSPERKIVIGESATRIIEGEPFLYPDFFRLLRMIRDRYPWTPVQITTNGLLLTEENIDQLVELGNMELNISVNCVNPAKRKQILGLKGEQDIAPILACLKKRVKYSGSCVMVPDIMDWGDVEEIVALLDKCGAENVRLFLPGYTILAGKEHSLQSLFRSAEGFIKEMRQKYAIPMVLEPSFIDGLECRIEGVVKDSPAYFGGLMAGDILLEVNGQKATTRVDGFERAFRLRDPRLKLQRGPEMLEVKLEKAKYTTSGFVVLYDISPEVVEEISKAVKRHEAKRVLLITSELAFDIMKELLQGAQLDFQYDVVSARNAFFGGNICCAGLLTLQDVMGRAETYLQDHEAPDLILLPPIMFDARKRDLTGMELSEMEKRLKIKAEIP